MALFLVGEKVFCSTQGLVHLDEDNYVGKLPFTINFSNDEHEVYELKREPLPFQTDKRMKIESYPHFISKMQQLGGSWDSDWRQLSPNDAKIILQKILDMNSYLP